MADEGMDSAPAALETPASGTEAATTTEPTNDNEGPQVILEPGEEPDEAEAGGTASDDDEEDELDFGFKKYRVPKTLKEAVEAMRADATKKHQSAAAEKKALEARKAELDQQAKVSTEELRDRAKLLQLDDHLALYAKLTKADWDAHENADPFATNKAWRQYQALKEERAEIAKSLEGKQKERTEKAHQDLGKRIQETLAFAAKEIPGWKPGRERELVTFAQKEIGLDEATIKQLMSPKFMQMAHLANLGSQLVKRQAAAKPIPQTVTPLRTVGGTSTPAKTDLASADMDAYIAARKKGVGGKALR